MCAANGINGEINKNRYDKQLTELSLKKLKEELKKALIHLLKDNSAEYFYKVMEAKNIEELLNVTDEVFTNYLQHKP